MKSKFFISVFVTFILNGCEQKNLAIQGELRLIKEATTDTTQPDYIRESVTIFEEILKGETSVSKDDWIQARVDMLEQRNQTTISVYVAFIRALEKILPEELPPPEEYDLLKDQTSTSEIIESNVARTILMLGSSIKEVSLYDDPIADVEIAGVMKRFKEKHGASETGKKILEFLNMVHGQGLTDRSLGIKPWETPRRPPEYLH